MNITIEVYDTISKQMVEIEVDEEFAKEYKRKVWREQNNDRSFRKHQIVVSQLTGGEDNNYENFHEFIVGDAYGGTDNRALLGFYKKRLRNALKELSESEQELLNQLFVQNKTERETAEIYNCSQVNIHKKKARILCKLNKLLKKH